MRYFGGVPTQKKNTNKSRKPFCPPGVTFLNYNRLLPTLESFQIFPNSCPKFMGVDFRILMPQSRQLTLGNIFFRAQYRISLNSGQYGNQSSFTAIKLFSQTVQFRYIIAPIQNNPPLFFAISAAILFDISLTSLP